MTNLIFNCKRVTESVLASSKFLYAAVVLAALSLIFMSPRTHAQQAPSQTPTVILVHGAWADGSSWSKVIPLLGKDGLHVVAVQLPLDSLANDVTTLKQAIAVVNGPVVLVGHSYGGVVITQAGDDEKVTGLVYVAAFAPDVSQSALDLLGKGPKTPVSSELRPDTNGFLKLTDLGIREDFAQDLSSVEKSVLIATQKPTSGNVLGTPVTIAAWHNKPTWFIDAENDRVIGPELERTSAAAMNAKVTAVVSSHVVMLSEPAIVAKVIEQAAILDKLH